MSCLCLYLSLSKWTKWLCQSCFLPRKGHGTHLGVQMIQMHWACTVTTWGSCSVYSRALMALKPASLYVDMWLKLCTGDKPRTSLNFTEPALTLYIFFSVMKLSWLSSRLASRMQSVYLSFMWLFMDLATFFKVAWNLDPLLAHVAKTIISLLQSSSLAYLPPNLPPPLC